MSIFKAITAAEEIPPATLVLKDAAIWLVRRGEYEAARVLLACELTLEPPTRYAGTPTGGLYVTVVYPAAIAPILLDEERSETVSIRKAIDVALPLRYFIDQLHLESASDPRKSLSLTVLSLPAPEIERTRGTGTLCSESPAGTTRPKLVA
ncbi:MAG: hypothetical protein ABSC51_12195 [Gaiellaceae bacterium]|jgi:hypothetical protein